MEVDGSQQGTPTQSSFQVETRPTKPKEESEVEELVNFPSAPGSETGDQEMNDAAVVKEKEGEKGDTVEESVQDKEGEEEEDAPVSTRLRRSKKDGAPKERVETETTSPKTRKGHKKGELVSSLYITPFILFQEHPPKYLLYLLAPLVAVEARMLKDRLHQSPPLLMKPMAKGNKQTSNQKAAKELLKTMHPLLTAINRPTRGPRAQLGPVS